MGETGDGIANRKPLDQVARTIVNVLLSAFLEE